MKPEDALQKLHRIFCAGPLPARFDLIVALHAIAKRVETTDPELASHASGIACRAELNLPPDELHRLLAQHGHWIYPGEFGKDHHA